MGWLVSLTQCNICTHIEVAVYPQETDETQLECSSCGAQDSTVLQRQQPDGSKVEQAYIIGDL